jgi:hypothetical protein
VDIEWDNGDTQHQLSTLIFHTAVWLGKPRSHEEILERLQLVAEAIGEISRLDELGRIEAATVHDDVWSIRANQIISLRDRKALLADLVGQLLRLVGHYSS